MWDKDASPYHPGEEELHARLGRQEYQERMGRQIHRPAMSDQHRSFFAQLPFLIAGSVDSQGWPWASILFGQPGFLSTPDAKTLDIDSTAIAGDPIVNNVVPGAPVSFVGIELPTRRRNRINGMVRSHVGTHMQVDVVQSFGNCPQYIHTRDLSFTRDPHAAVPIECDQFTTLDACVFSIIARADTLFVASHNDRDDPLVNGGVDVNHRGGKPGFVKVEGNTLSIPDYIGNFAFNTLGNFNVNPKAGLLFIDLDSGDLLQLTGDVELLWEPTEEIRAYHGAERAWRFHIQHGQRLIAASPLRFSDGEASPNSLLTGSWIQADETLQAEAAGQAWRSFRVSRVEEESAVIRSFYLEPADGKGMLNYKPGQYLTLRVNPDGADRPAIRTYTLSSAPSDEAYRISVKREDAAGNQPVGAVSNHLHSTLTVGDLIDVRAPTGAFWMNTEEVRPALLIAGGVGITPMISMARQAVLDGISRRHLRHLTILHGARSTADRAFLLEFTALQKAAEGRLRYFSVIGHPVEGEHAGSDFHVAGRINAEIVQSALSSVDSDVYLCGPPAFMQTLYDMMIDLGVSDTRIFAETFGPASLKRQPEEGVEIVTFDRVEEALVHFSASGVDLVWKAGDGTLLELAEAHGLAPDYGCRSGACGSCAVRLASGRIGYVNRPTYQPDTGDVLMCCAVPALSDNKLMLDV